MWGLWRSNMMMIDVADGWRRRQIKIQSSDSKDERHECSWTSEVSVRAILSLATDFYRFTRQSNYFSLRPVCWDSISCLGHSIVNSQLDLLANLWNSIVAVSIVRSTDESSHFGISLSRTSNDAGRLTNRFREARSQFQPLVICKALFDRAVTLVNFYEFIHRRTIPGREFSFTNPFVDETTSQMSLKQWPWTMQRNISNELIFMSIHRSVAQEKAANYESFSMFRSLQLDVRFWIDETHRLKRNVFVSYRLDRATSHLSLYLPRILPMRPIHTFLMIGSVQEFSNLSLQIFFEFSMNGGAPLLVDLVR